MGIFPCTYRWKRTEKEQIFSNIYENLVSMLFRTVQKADMTLQGMELGTPEGVIASQGIQAAAPVDSYVSPEPWVMPGYDSAGDLAACVCTRVIN